MLSLPHLIILFVVALIVFGPEKLPQLARDLGKAMAEFRRHSAGLRLSLEENLRELEREVDTKHIEPAPQPALAQPSLPVDSVPAALPASAAETPENLEKPADGHSSPA